MTVDDALQGGTKLGLDTAPFIYLVENNPAYVAVVEKIFRRIDAGAVQGFSSIITLAEVLIHPKQLGDAALETQYRNILLSGRNFTLLSLDTLLADASADLRARYRLRLADSLQIAATLSAGCEAFLTNDRGLKRVTELRILVVDELSL